MLGMITIMQGVVHRKLTALHLIKLVPWVAAGPQLPCTFATTCDKGYEGNVTMIKGASGSPREPLLHPSGPEPEATMHLAAPSTMLEVKSSVLDRL